MLRRFFPALMLAAGLVLTGTAAASATVDVPTPSGSVFLQLPEGYTELDADEIAVKFDRNNRKPLKAYGNAARTSTVAITWSEMKQRPLTQKALPGFKDAMVDMLPRMAPGTQFQESAIVAIGARNWVHLHSTTPAIDTVVVNRMYLTDLGGHMVAVNFNSTEEEYPEERTRFERAAQSLAVKP